MNWFRNSEYMTFRFVRKTSLQLQILLINAVGLLNLVGSSFDWGWLKGDLQLKKIWELSALQSDSSEVKDIEWIKTVLSHIIVLRLIINSITLVAHVANIYTILTRDRQNLLILWMVLSFLKDILLEVVVVIVTIILWHNGCITTSLLVEFIIKKAMWLAFSTWKWCTTLSWYMQLQKMAKIREVFDLITRRSNIILDTARKAGHSMDDASLDIAIGRRDKQASSGNERKRSISNSRIKNDRVDDAILRSQNVESLRFITAKPNSVKNEDENKNICGRTNEFLPDQFPKTYSSDESDFNSLYEKNTDRSEPTLNEGSLMEEFSNDTVSPTTLSNIDP